MTKKLNLTKTIFKSRNLFQGIREPFTFNLYDIVKVEREKLLSDIKSGKYNITHHKIKTEICHLTYDQYMHTDLWIKIRQFILRRDNWRCRACHTTSSNIQVHHRDYSEGAKTGKSPEALICLCIDCHNKVENDVISADGSLIKASLYEKELRLIEMLTSFPNKK